MKIWVILKNGKPDNVPDYLLGAMIEAGEVTSILRSEGWAKIGVDPVRKRESDLCYYGPEKRKLNQQRLCLTCSYFVEGECTNQVCPIRYVQMKNYSRQE